MKTNEEKSDLLKQICYESESDEIHGNDNGLKILIIVNQLIAVLGGGAKHIFEVVNYWTPTNEVTFLFSEAECEVARESMLPGSGKHVMTYSTILDYRTRPYVLKKFVHLSRLFKCILLALKLRREKYDVVIASNFYPENIVPVSFFRGKAKLVVFFHGGSPFLRREELKKRGTFRRIISMLNWEFCVIFSRLYDLIFVAEISTKKYFIARGFDPQHVIVVGNGVPFEMISGIISDNKEYDGVFLGQLVPGKIRDLIEVWKEVNKVIPGAKFCIIGDGPNRKELETQAVEYGLNITFKGWISGREKYMLMKSSKVFVFPSYYESWGIVVAEALACGLPVVAYSQPVYREVFGNALIGVKIGEIKEMAKKIINVLKNNYTNKEGMQVASKLDWKDVASNELLNIKRR